MKSLLNSSSIEYNQIQEMYTTYKITEDDPSLSSISYIIALWNFELFYQLMTLVNVDLQLEALHYIQQKYGNQFMYVYILNNFFYLKIICIMIFLISIAAKFI